MRRICPRCGSRDTIRITDSSERTHHCHVCRRDFGRRYSADPVCVHKMYFYVGGFSVRTMKSTWIPSDTASCLSTSLAEPAVSMSRESSFFR